ncbi:MAG: ADP-ribosylglycohydrolase family protein [Akkermansiaceae bacterium]|nr:ADP-ribosylglycohydrolase family protein [Akkermansiaceae bacterium]
MTHEERKDLSRTVLEGLSVGDAFGEAFAYGCANVRQRIQAGIAAGPYWWTDDTAMAIGIVECLHRSGGIAEDMLAWIFSRNLKKDPDRGYGKMARRILDRIGQGENWMEVSSTAFDGGSMGNGAAMRVGPLAGWFADDLDRLVTETWKSARVTHWHPEGIAGAISVAVAVACAWQTRGLPASEAGTQILTEILKRTPESGTRDGILTASRLDPMISSAAAARILGNGSQVTAPDTVPFVIWSALRSLDDYQEAFISTVEADGDCDTNAAMVGSILAARLGIPGIPVEWRESREALPDFD